MLPVGALYVLRKNAILVKVMMEIHIHFVFIIDFAENM